jgi:hypothetical protein
VQGLEVLQFANKKLVVKGKQRLQFYKKLIRRIECVDQNCALSNVIQAAAIARLEEVNQFIGLEIRKLKPDDNGTPVFRSGTP